VRQSPSIGAPCGLYNAGFWSEGASEVHAYSNPLIQAVGEPYENLSVGDEGTNGQRAIGEVHAHWVRYLDVSNVGIPPDTRA